MIMAVIMVMVVVVVVVMMVPGVPPVARASLMSASCHCSRKSPGEWPGLSRDQIRLI